MRLFNKSSFETMFVICVLQNIRCCNFFDIFLFYLNTMIYKVYKFAHSMYISATSCSNTNTYTS